MITLKNRTYTSNINGYGMKHLGIEPLHVHIETTILRLRLKNYESN